MRITSRRHLRVGDHLVVSADVAWEDCDRKSRTIYACVPAAGPVAGGAEWMVLSTAFIAARYGERRLAIDQPLDPLLRQGLGCAMEQLRVWYGARRIRIEAPTAARPERTAGRGGRVAGVFVSGGVDSWATLIRNRADVPDRHPLAFRIGLHVDWMGPRDVADLTSYLGSTGARWVRSASGRTLAGTGLHPVTVVTNARRLDGNVFHWDWMFSDHGAMFAAVAHLLTARLWLTSIAATYHLDQLRPLGSHPILDPWYGSTSLRIRHDSPDLSRLAKLRMLVGRREVIEALDVCSYWFQQQEAAAANCGRCEKCLRTLFGLEALGFDTSGLPNFAPADLAERLGTLDSFQDEYERCCWADIQRALLDRGHAYGRPVTELMHRATVRTAPWLAGGSR